MIGMDTPYTVIPVTVMAASPSVPDGDSVRLLSEDSAMWPEGVRFSRSNHSVQIRAKGIDALELHFFGLHQPLRWAREARDRLLALLEVDQPQHDHPKAWALTRSVDPYGRAITFVVPGSVALEAGAMLAVGSADLKDAVTASVNYQLLAAGLVYPLFYESLPDDLRRKLSDAAKEAYQEGEGLWPEDKTGRGVVINGERDVGDFVMMPKLYRRLLRYYEQGRRDKGLGGVRNFLKRNPDPLHLAHELEGDGDPRVRYLHDRDILGVEGNKMWLKVPQWELLWHEKGSNPFMPNNGVGVGGTEGEI